MAEPKHIETQGCALVVVSVVLLTIANVFCVLRVATRASKKQLGMDDYILGLATISLDIQMSFVFCSIYYGFGKHGKDLTRENHLEALRHFYLIQVMYKIVGGFTKAAFVLLYLRIFARPRFQWFVKRILMVVIVTSSIAFTVVTIFQCKPIELAWNKRLSGKCINNTAFWYAHAAVHTSLDLVIFSMPIPLVWKLQMPFQKKVDLVLLFILGFFGCIASIVRMTYLIGSSKTKDPTWGSYSALMWTVIEANISIICACLPPLRGPAAAAFRRMRGQEGPSTHDQSYNMKALSSAKQRKASLMGITELSNWQKRTENSAFATKGEESATPRSGSEESIIPRALSVGITKTTKWEVCESDVLQSDVPEVPKLVHSKV